MANALSKSHLSIFAAATLLGTLLLSTALQPKVANFFSPPLWSITLSGDYLRIDQVAVEYLLQKFMGIPFFQVDIDEVATRIIDFPWIKEASVYRHWPDKLVISLKERQPIARWNKSLFIDEDGEIFPLPNEEKVQLPHILGEDKRSLFLLSTFLKYSESLATIKREISVLEQTPRHSLKIELDNRIKINLGKKNMDARMATFVSAYHKGMQEIFDQTSCIEMRYRFGFAIRLKDGMHHDSDAC